VILLAGGGDEAQAQRVDVRHEVTTPTAEDKRKSELQPGKNPITWTLTGETTGTLGKGNITAIPTLQPAGPPPGAKGSKPPPKKKGGKKGLVTVRITVRFSDGTIRATERLNNEVTGGGIKVTGRGRFIGGTGKYEGATGTFKVTGERPVFTESFETVHWTGKIEY
jgi:hypothetical protein